MIHLRHYGTKGLVEGMDDRTNRRLWAHYLFVKIEHVVANPNDFPEQWNFARKYCYLEYVLLLSL